MSCTNPNIVRFCVDPDSGSITHEFLGPARMLDPNTFGDPNSLSTRGYYLRPVPCGHCPDCRAAYAREWSNRCLLELQDMGCAIFVTLTYSNEHLPLSSDGIPTLCIRDTQLFMKRLRKHFSDKRIRFYLVGEYGSKTSRPHYHAILFGLDLTDFSDLQVKFYNEIGQPVFVSDIFSNIWSLGICSIGSVTKKSCDYVARYVLKKQNDLDADGQYPLGVKPPFSLASRKPGIGMLHATDYIMSDKTHFVVNDKQSVYEFPLPCSIIKNVKSSTNSFEVLDKISFIMYNNAVNGNSRLLSELAAYGLPYDEVLKRKAQSRIDRLNLLPERK